MCSKIYDKPIICRFVFPYYTNLAMVYIRDKAATAYLLSNDL